MPSFSLGESIPPDTAHAVSVSLPTWKSNIGYEEGSDWVIKTMVTGYPRFFVHKSVQAFAADIVAKLVGKPPGSGWTALLFPSRQAAARCLDFIRDQAAAAAALSEAATIAAAPAVGEDQPRAVHLVLDATNPATRPLAFLRPAVSAVACPPAAYLLAKQYWQHTGDGVSSRRAEFCHALFRDGLLRPAADDGKDGASVRPSPSVVAGEEAQHHHAPTATATATAAAAIQASGRPCKGPKRYQRPIVTTPTSPTAATTTTTIMKTVHQPRGDGPASPPPSPTARKQQDNDAQETSRFVEERWGRNLDLSLVERAKSAIRRRIAGALRSDGDDHHHGLAAAARPGEMEANSRGIAGLCEDDVLLYPNGMNAIFNAHRMLLAAAVTSCNGNNASNGSPALVPAPTPTLTPPSLRSICFGFSYVDTLKLLQKFGPGCVFYPHGSEAELDDLEARLGKDGGSGGEKFLALFCEFPANPLLSTPNLARIRRLADAHGFAVVVDETVGTLANVNVLPFADVVVSSLTKIFSGACNVMGGAAVLNPRGNRHAALRRANAPAEAGGRRRGQGEEGGVRNEGKEDKEGEREKEEEEEEEEKEKVGLGIYEDAVWEEDIVFLERNSRDFASRIDRINANAEALCDLLSSLTFTGDDADKPKGHNSQSDQQNNNNKNAPPQAPLVRQVYYPRQSATRANYDACRLAGGGYGGLLSVVFGTRAQAVAFYDALDTAKGPSLGTNFTLVSPYTLLAHYQELDWAEACGIDRNLVRISVGLEETAELVSTFRTALDVAAKTV